MTIIRSSLRVILIYLFTNSRTLSLFLTYLAVKKISKYLTLEITAAIF